MKRRVIEGDGDFGLFRKLLRRDNNCIECSNGGLFLAKSQPNRALRQLECQRRFKKKALEFGQVVRDRLAVDIDRAAAKFHRKNHSRKLLKLDVTGRRNAHRQFRWDVLRVGIEHEFSLSEVGTDFHEFFGQPAIRREIVECVRLERSSHRGQRIADDEEVVAIGRYVIEKRKVCLSIWLSRFCDPSCTSAGNANRDP